jgi:hypothetical protein
MKKLFAGLLVAIGLAACTHGVTHHIGIGGGKVRASSHFAHAKFKVGAYETGHVYAYHYRHGKLIGRRDFGLGTISDLVVDSMANDPFWASPSAGPYSTLTNAKYSVTGTSTNAPAATDLTLFSPDSVAPTLCTQSVNLVPNAAQYIATCTMNYSITESVTEWALQAPPPGTPSLGTPWTGGSVTTGIATGSPYAASTTNIAGQQQYVFEDVTLNCYGLALSNTTSTVTVNGWYNVGARTICSSGGFHFPQSGDTLKILPLQIDRQEFTSIGVQSGDSIQFKIVIALPSGS